MALQNRKFLSLRTLTVFVLAGLLIAYHSLTLLGDFETISSGTTPVIEYIQSALRILIILSLLLVIIGIRNGLIGMWIGITGLIASQYWVHFGDPSLNMTDARHVLSYLRGFVFPTFITTLVMRGKVADRS